MSRRNCQHRSTTFTKSRYADTEWLTSALYASCRLFNANYTSAGTIRLQPFAGFLLILGRRNGLPWRPDNQTRIYPLELLGWLLPWLGRRHLRQVCVRRETNDADRGRGSL